jgi:hypothetical protein
MEHTACFKKFQREEHLVCGGKTEMAEQIIATMTRSHSIVVVDGYLTIRGEQQTLTPDEVEQLLETLLIWRYGLEELPVDESES